jgi:glycerophosphoryl diester phosphodiesterase
MILIAHRGNTDGKFESYENEPAYIDKAISEGFDVEVDVWMIEGVLLLGHDEPQYGVTQQWFNERFDKLWIHCKNIEAMEWFNMIDGFNYFWHEEDTVTLTSQGAIWAYPGKQPIKRSIAVMPEINNDDTSQCLGICSDYIKKYKDGIII